MELKTLWRLYFFIIYTFEGICNVYFRIIIQQPQTVSYRKNLFTVDIIVYWIIMYFNRRTVFMSLSLKII